MEIYKVFRREITCGLGWDERDDELGYYDSVEKVIAEYPDATDEDNNPKHYIPGTNMFTMKMDGIFYKKIEVK